MPCKGHSCAFCPGTLSKVHAGRIQGLTQRLYVVLLPWSFWGSSLPHHNPFSWLQVEPGWFSKQWISIHMRTMWLEHFSFPALSWLNRTWIPLGVSQYCNWIPWRLTIYLQGFPEYKLLGLWKSSSPTLLFNLLYILKESADVATSQVASYVHVTWMVSFMNGVVFP